MWLRPSKENSGATCQSKTKKSCSINSAVVREIHEDITARTCCSAKALYVRQGYLRSAAVRRSPARNFSHCPFWVVHFERLKVPKLHTGLIVLLLKNLAAKLEQFSPLTLITLRPCKTWLTQAGEGAPFAVTVPPHATGGELLPVGAVVINKRAAWCSVGGFSWGTKVI